MPDYRRRRVPGATYCLTVVTQRRRPLFSDPQARRLLRDAFVRTRGRPRSLTRAALISSARRPGIWILPPGDADFSGRWSPGKRTFRQACRRAGRPLTPVSSSRARRRELGVWQRRFWKHMIRDERESFAYRRHPPRPDQTLRVADS